MAVTLAETILTLGEAAKLLPPGRNGRPVNLTTILRWVTDGVEGPTRKTVRLEASRWGNRWYTSREALDRFAQRLTPQFEVADGD